jgi:anaphase-promoting complex subunit 10
MLPNVSLFRRSDAVQPHFVTIQFPKLTSVSMIEFYINAQVDESYTPNRFSICHGTTMNNMQMIEEIELDAPRGWICVKLFNST